MATAMKPSDALSLKRNTTPADNQLMRRKANIDRHEKNKRNKA